MNNDYLFDFPTVQCECEIKSIYKTLQSFEKPKATMSPITSYLFLCRLEIKQGRHGTSGGQSVGEHM